MYPNLEFAAISVQFVIDDVKEVFLQITSGK